MTTGQVDRKSHQDYSINIIVNLEEGRRENNIRMSHDLTKQGKDPLSLRAAISIASMSNVGKLLGGIYLWRSLPTHPYSSRFHA